MNKQAQVTTRPEKTTLSAILLGVNLMMMLILPFHPDYDIESFGGLIVAYFFSTISTVPFIFVPFLMLPGVALLIREKKQNRQGFLYGFSFLGHGLFLLVYVIAFLLFLYLVWNCKVRGRCIGFVLGTMIGF